MLKVIVFFVVLCDIIICLNIDIVHPIIYDDPSRSVNVGSNSHFGYSVKYLPQMNTESNEFM